MPPVARSLYLGIHSARVDQFRRKLVTHRELSHASGDINPSENHARVRQYASVILNQKITIIGMISSQDYARRSDRSSSVGAHMRHSLDHFDTVFSAEEAYSVLDYDARNRNTDIERQDDAALTKCMGLLSKLTSMETDLPVQVKFISDPSTGEAFTLPSTKFRELAFVSHHAVHHLSSIKAIMETFGYDFKNDSVGLANSTIMNDRKEDQQISDNKAVAPPASS